MKQLDRLARRLNGFLEGREVLEVACGCADFSLAAAPSASRITCIDLDEHRLNPLIFHTPSIAFCRMDAARMAFPDASFDTVVVCNALYHLRSCLPQVVAECLRVRRDGGHVVLISSFKLDAQQLHQEVPDMLARLGVSWYADRLSPYEMIVF